VVALGAVRRTLALALLVTSNLCLALVLWSVRGAHLVLALGAVRRTLAVVRLALALGSMHGAHLALALLVTSNLCLALALRGNHLAHRTKL
jgi:hypothetical protein